MHKNTDFFSAFSLMHRPLINHTNRILENHGLSSSYWRVMRVLDSDGKRNFGDITHELQIEKPALTKIIKKLCEMNIVEVQRGKDKREKIVLLTPTGEEILTEIRKELSPFFDQALEGLTQEQIDSAKEVLQIIQKNMKNC